MNIKICRSERLMAIALGSVLVFAHRGSAQSGVAAPQRDAQHQAQRPGAPPLTAPTDAEFASTQEQLLQLLRTSPMLTTVVARDPSLLSDEAYVSRNNPQLEQFLVQHPDVARNPEYYLFTHLNSRGGRREQALERAVWPDLSQPRYEPDRAESFMQHMMPLVAFIGFLIALLWLTRIFLENRRWSRTFKLQSDVHARLIERFSSMQELSSYMETEAGKRFLEAAPIPLGLESEQRLPNAVARVLTPLQIGVVLVLLGAGLLLLRNAGPDTGTPMLVLGTIVLMPGIGFILSAGITWVLAGRLGLIPGKQASEIEPGAIARPQDRQ